MPIHNPPVPGSGGIGDLIGPASSTDNAVTRFDGTTGKLVQNSNVTISDAGTVTLAGGLNDADYVTVASASTCDIGAAASSNVAISGTTTITSFGTANAGITRRCRATGAFLITYNGTSLITCNAKNIVTKADDCFEMTSLGSGNWLMTSYKPADGCIFANAVNAQTGTTYTLAITDLGNDVTFSNAAATTLTLPQTSNVAFPIGSKVKIINLGVGAVTIVKEGAETLLGNTLLAQYATALIEKISATSWQVFGGTAVVNEVINFCFSGAILNRAYDISVRMPFAGTILGLTSKVTSLVTAGNYTVAISGVNVTGLTAITNTTARTNTTATAANTFVAGDYITLTMASTATVVDCFGSLEYTRTY
jgi:hypothetical protein